MVNHEAAEVLQSSSNIYRCILNAYTVLFGKVEGKKTLIRTRCRNFNIIIICEELAFGNMVVEIWFHKWE